MFGISHFYFFSIWEGQKNNNNGRPRWILLFFLAHMGNVGSNKLSLVCVWMVVIAPLKALCFFNCSFPCSLCLIKICVLSFVSNSFCWLFARLD